MFQKNEKIHPELLVETALPLTNHYEPRSIDAYHKVDALGLHVLLLGARERQVSLLDPLFRISDSTQYDSRLDILARSDLLSGESSLDKTPAGDFNPGSFGFLASIEPHARAASLLLEGRIVNPFSLLATQEMCKQREGKEHITLVVSFPTEDRTLAEASLVFLQSIDDCTFETMDWRSEHHSHFETSLTRYTVSLRPRPTTLVFPLGAPTL